MFADVSCLRKTVISVELNRLLVAGNKCHKGQSISLLKTLRVAWRIKVSWEKCQKY